MTHLGETLKFLLRYTIAGLALAFLVVALRPEWLPRTMAPASALRPASYADAVQVSATAVVSIFSLRSARADDGSERQLITSLGSGVLMDPGGYILTNLHVIQDASQIRIQLTDGRVAEPRLVGIDSLTDLAALRINLSGLPTIPLGRSDTLRIGDVVLAIGNPFGLGQTVTQGIVSATGRGLGLSLIEDYIQTDAAINVGNSGGALVNARGELIGINAASLEPSLQPYGLSLPEGIGFAIPVNLARGVMAELIEHGRVLRGWLGVQAIELSPGRAAVLGLSGGGLELTEVYPDSPAHEAGLRPGDILTDIDGQRVLLRTNALNLIARLKPGGEVRIAGMRGNQRFERTVTVVARPD
jgi:serine peptidase DegS